jgi:ferredoxin
MQAVRAEVLKHERHCGRGVHPSIPRDERYFHARNYIMALKITEQCVNCDVCEPVCPNKAISLGAAIYEIAADHCTECVGHFDAPQCVEVCPVECIIVDLAHAETREQLLAKYRQLTVEDKK